MTQPLGNFSGADFIKGLSPSLPYREGRLLKAGKNVLFAEQSVQPIPGQTLLVGKPEVAPVRGMVELLDDVPTLYFGTVNSLYRWKLGDLTATNVGGGFEGNKNETPQAPASIWSMVSFGKWALAANGKENPLINKGTGSFLFLTDWPVGVRVLGRIGPFVIGFGNTADPAEIVWSTDDDPEVTTPTLENKAGFLTARDLGSAINAAVPLRDGIAFYGSDAMHYLSLVGYPDWFGQRRLLSGVGVVGPNAVCAVGSIHYGFSHRGIFATDGTQPNWLLDQPIHDYIYDNLNRDQLSKVTAWHWKTHKMVAFFYPTLGAEDLSAGVAYNYSNGSWTILGFTRTAVTDASVFPFPIAGDASGNLFKQDQEGTTPDADPSKLELKSSGRLSSGVGTFGVGQDGFGGFINGQG